MQAEYDKYTSARPGTRLAGLHPCDVCAAVQVWEEFHDRPGWKVVTRTKSYADDYASSKFCLAAPGGGWGKRGIVSAMCVAGISLPACWQCGLLVPACCIGRKWM